MDPLIIEIIALVVGIFLGYYARQMIAKKRAGTIEKILAKKIQKGKLEAQKILTEAEEKAQKLTESTKNEIQQRHKELSRTESLVLKRESMLEQKIT